MEPHLERSLGLGEPPLFLFDLRCKLTPCVQRVYVFMLIYIGVAEPLCAYRESCREKNVR